MTVSAEPPKSPASVPSVSPDVPPDRNSVFLKTSSGSREVPLDDLDDELERLMSGSEDGTVEVYERGRLSTRIVKTRTRVRQESVDGKVLEEKSLDAWFDGRAQGQLTACKSNCKNMATALEMYASDNGGRYPLPGRLDACLTAGHYLRQVPTCPAARLNTFSGTYNSIHDPDSFSFQCAGNNHGRAYTGFAGNPTNYPQYDAEQGLLDHP